MFRRILLTILITPFTACAEPTVEPFVIPPPPGALEGTIQVDPPNPNGGKKFQGVWFVTSDGNKKLVAYNTRSVWAQFEGKAVSVNGADYIPNGQAITADHFRIDHLKVTNAQDATLYVSAGPETKMQGTMYLNTGEPGSKMADSTWWVFSSGGLQYQILNDGGWRLEKPEVTVTAHRVERSPFSAHMPGPSLWVTKLEHGHGP